MAAFENGRFISTKFLDIFVNCFKIVKRVTAQVFRKKFANCKNFSLLSYPMATSRNVSRQKCIEFPQLLFKNAKIGYFSAGKSQI